MASVTMYTVLISTSTFGVSDATPLRRLDAAGMTYRLNPYGRTLREQEVMALLEDAVGIIAGTEPLSRAVLEGASKLRVISRVGVGRDNVDEAAAQRLGVAVYTTPEAPTQAVAELTIAGTLALLRHVPRMDAGMRQREWHKEMGSLLAGKTLGIVGLGRVGKRVAQLLGPWGVEILATDVASDTAWAKEHRVQLVAMERLLQRADIVTMHVGGDWKGGALLGARELALMKPGGYLINTARGGLVDEVALLSALESGHLAGAYLDVFTEEPYEGPLSRSDSVVLTPHVGSYAAEARVRMEMEAVDNLLSGLGANQETP